jgi:hypothetical protein
LVGNDPQWFGTLGTQEFSKESLCGALITMRLDQNVNHAAVLIHGAPQIPLLAVDSNEDLIQVPVVTQPSLSSLQFPSIIETEFLTLLPDRLIGDDDSALGEKILDIPETEAEAMISPDRIADDLGRETIAGVTRAIALHGTSVSGFLPQVDNAFQMVADRIPVLDHPFSVRCRSLYLQSRSKRASCASKLEFQWKTCGSF